MQEAVVLNSIIGSGSRQDLLSPGSTAFTSREREQLALDAGINVTL